MDRFIVALFSVLRDRFWPIYMYLAASFVLTLGALIDNEIHVALCLGGTSFISLIAAGGLKFGILWGDRAQKIAVPLVALLLFAFAYWLSPGFYVQLWGHRLSGLTWGLIGVLVEIVFCDRNMASRQAKAQPQSSDTVAAAMMDVANHFPVTGIKQSELVGSAAAPAFFPLLYGLYEFCVLGFSTQHYLLTYVPVFGAVAAFLGAGLYTIEFGTPGMGPEIIAELGGVAAYAFSIYVLGFLGLHSLWLLIAAGFSIWRLLFGAVSILVGYRILRNL